MSPRLPFLMLLPCLSLGCAIGARNPSFAVTPDDADEAMKAMKAQPKPLERPLVIVGGYLDPGIGPLLIRDRLRALTGDGRIETVSLFTCGDFDDCRRRIVEAVDRAFPCTDPDGTAEVDVIGVSMGGVAARYAAAPSRDDEHARGARRLRIKRLFTVSSPHRGAVLALLPSPHKLAAQMCSGSDFLTSLNAPGTAADYPLYPYVRLSDGVVGESNAAPPGRNPWWVPSRLFEESHSAAATDPRILADIARRLRGEEPFTHDPPAPLPE